MHYDLKLALKASYTCIQYVIECDMFKLIACYIVSWSRGFLAGSMNPLTQHEWTWSLYLVHLCSFLLCFLRLLLQQSIVLTLALWSCNTWQCLSHFENNRTLFSTMTYLWNLQGGRVTLIIAGTSSKQSAWHLRTNYFVNRQSMRSACM